MLYFSCSSNLNNCSLVVYCSGKLYYISVSLFHTFLFSSFLPISLSSFFPLPTSLLPSFFPLPSFLPPYSFPHFLSSSHPPFYFPPFLLSFRTSFFSSFLHFFLTYVLSFFIPSFLLSLLPSVLPFSFPSCLFPSFLLSVIRSFLLSFLLSYFPGFLLSFILEFLLSYFLLVFSILIWKYMMLLLNRITVNSSIINLRFTSYLMTNRTFFAELADSFIKISGGLVQLANSDNGLLDKYLSRVSDTFERARVSIFI